MFYHCLLFAIPILFCVASSVHAIPANEASASGKRIDSDHEDIQKAKRRKVQLEKNMIDYREIWDEANRHVKVGHSGRKSWIKLWKQQKHQDGIARKYNLYGNLLKENTQVEHGMHIIANDHAEASKKIQQKMNEIKEKGNVSPARAQQQTEEHYSQVLRYSTDIMKEDKTIHGQNRCRMM